MWVASQRPVAPDEGDRAAAGAAERGAVRPDAERVPRGGHPGLVADDGAAGPRVVHGELPDVAPDLVPLRIHDALDALRQGVTVPKATISGAHIFRPALEVHAAHARLPVAQPGAQRLDRIGGGAHRKIDSGRNADTIQLGASTISLIFRSTATEQTM